MKFLTWQNPEQLFVAQELINKVKSKCCGIKGNKGKGDVVSKGLREVSFEDNLLVEDKGGLLASLHKLIDGRKGKFVAIVMKVCCDYGIMMAKPTYTQVKKEFGDIGVKSGYDAYMVDGKIKEDEKKPVSVALSKYLM